MTSHPSKHFFPREMHPDHFGFLPFLELAAYRVANLRVEPGEVIQ
jgi:hypothetical protein